MSLVYEVGGLKAAFFFCIVDAASADLKSGFYRGGLEEKVALLLRGPVRFSTIVDI